MIQLPKDFDSIFRYIAVVSQRAEQLINGAKVRTDSRSLKPTLQARDDVDAGEVPWRVLTQEELDAQRQALVDQFRADLATEEGAEGRSPIQDVLPTSPVGVADAADEEGDDELLRLQRLLGMARGAAEPDEDADADEGDDDGPTSDSDEDIETESLEALDLDEGDDDEDEDD